MRKRQSMSMFLSVAMACSLATPLTAWAVEADRPIVLEQAIQPVEPTQDENGVYQLSTAAHLVWFQNAVAQEVAQKKNAVLSAVLTGDIILTEPWTPIGTKPDGTVDSSKGYSGEFNGNGYTISGLSIEAPEKSKLGLFALLSDGAKVHDLTVAGSITGKGSVGGIAGHVTGTTVTIANCTNQVTLNGSANYVGGIAGNFSASKGIITNCVNSAALNSTAGYIGGMTGYGKGAVDHCSNTGKISGQNNVGGLAGNFSGLVSDCSNTGDVTGVKNNVGGIVSYASGDVSGCVNTGTVSGEYDVGGITGYTNKKVSCCYNTGAISATPTAAKTGNGVGGIIGRSGARSGGAMDHCYNTGVVSATDPAKLNVGALVGYKSTSPSVIAGYFLTETAAEGIGKGAGSKDLIFSLAEEDLKNPGMVFDLGNEFVVPAAGGMPILAWEEPDTPHVTCFKGVQAEDVLTVTAADGQTVEPLAPAYYALSTDAAYQYQLSRGGAVTASGEVCGTAEHQTITVGESTKYEVSFTVTPADASITVQNSAGETVDADPDGIYRLLPGTYAYTVTAAGYESQTGELTVTADSVPAPVVTLNQLSTVSIDVKDESGQMVNGANIKVFRDGVQVANGRTMDLTDGEYTYTVEAKDYQKAEGSFTVKGEALTVPITMKKVESGGSDPVIHEDKMMSPNNEYTYAGDGTPGNPYRLLIAKKEGYYPPNTAPRQFWNANGGKFCVDFEQRAGNVPTGELLYSYEFNTDKSTGNLVDGQDGARFRFTPYCESRANADNTLDIGFSWKGNFGTFWTDWTYTVNVSALSKQAIKPNDTVEITYYGGYNKGFDNGTGHDLTYEINLDVKDQAAEWTKTTTLDEQGLLTFSGADMLVYGGNYKIEKAAAPVEDAITDAGRSLSLEGKIHINQYAKITGFEGVDIEKNGGLLVWTSPVTEENATVENAEVNKPGLEASDSGYSQETDGIASAQYADTLYLRIYVRNLDGTYTYGPLKEYSVRTYCENKISENTSIKDTCVALLHYGAAAQLYFHYNIHDLANKNIAADYPSKAWNPDYLTPLLKAESALTASDLVRSTGKSLSLEGSILVNFYFDTDVQDVKSSELLVWESNAAPLSEENVSYRTALNKEGDLYRAESHDFVSCHYGKTIFVCAKFVDQAGNVYYSEIAAYSPETYAANKISQNTNPELVDTVKKMVMYGEEAQKYFNQ